MEHTEYDELLRSLLVERFGRPAHPARTCQDTREQVVKALRAKAQQPAGRRRRRDDPDQEGARP
jgi:hypothetical protein